MKITKWYREIKDEKKNVYFWDFNHISDGYDEKQTHPKHRFDSQKGWAKAKWKPVEAQLVDGKVVAL